MGRHSRDPVSILSHFYSVETKTSAMDPLFIVALLILGCVTGFAAGLLGIGGGMLLVPFLTLLLTWQKLSPELIVHTAIATSMASILFTSVSSVRAHNSKGAVRWDLVWALTPGILVGGLISGGAIFAALKTGWLALFFAIFVGYSAFQMLRGRCPGKGGRLRPAARSDSSQGWWVQAVDLSLCRLCSGVMCRCTRRLERPQRWVFRSRSPIRLVTSGQVGAKRGSPPK